MKIILAITIGLVLVLGYADATVREDRHDITRCANATI